MSATSIVPRLLAKPLFAFLFACLLACAGAARADDAIEVLVNWKIGEMAPNQAANLVYVINETDGDLLAISTAGGNVTAHKRFDYSLDDAELFLAANASALYVSLPSIQKLYALNPTTLAQISVVDLDVRIKGFVIPSDGYLYALDEGESTHLKLVKLDPSTGTELERLNTPSIYNDALFRLASDGSNFYVLERGLSGGSSGVSEFATTAGLPSLVAEHFTGKSNDRDLSVDDANDRLYRASGGIYGVGAWNIAAETQEFWSFGGPPYGMGVAQLPGSDYVWGASGSIYDGTLAKFDKQTTLITREITVGRNNSTLNDGTVMPGRFELTSNDRLLYGKDDWTGSSSLGVDGYYYYIGVTDILSLSVDYTPSTIRPFAPIRVTATDATQAGRVDVSWDESPRATLYRIYRSTTDDSSAATQVGTTNTGETFSDTTAVVGQTYYYWVRAENGGGQSPFGLSDPGSVLPPPGPITSFTATDGDYVNSVRVSRSYDSAATGFRVYRNTTNDFAGATEIGNSSSTIFTDTTVPVGQTHYYWGRAENAAGLGPVSAADTGHAGDLFPPSSAPTNLSASDGTHPYQVSITWTGVSDSRSYEILRHTSDDSGSAVSIGSSTNTSFNDTSAVELVDYYYWVRAVNTAGNGPLSTSDAGQRAELTPPAAPASISATDGSFNDRIWVSWSSSSYADDYTVLRHSSDDPGSATEIMTTTSTSYSDYGAVPGPTYYYWVRGNNASGSGALSSSDSGFATIPPPPAAPPASVFASDGSFDDRVRITWSSVTYARSYLVYRATTDNSGSATQIGTSPETTFEDFTAVPLQTYYYWIKASNVAGETGFSPSDSGYAVVGEPDNVYATSDLFDTMVRVTWNSVEGASRYRVFRHTNSQSTSATEVAIVDAPALRYEDLTANPGQTYHYWVKAELPAGQIGDFGDSDDGRRASAPPQGSGFIAVDDPRDVDFDMLRDKAYITTAKGIVEVYDLTQEQILNAEWNTDGGLSGADIGPNNQTLLLAQTRTSNLGWVDAIDLSTDTLQSYGYTLAFNEIGAYDVTILGGDQALVTTGFGGSGWTPFRKLDLSTGTFSIIDTTGIGSGSAGIRQNSLLSRTPDRSLVAIQESNTSSGPFFTYDATTEMLGSPTDTGGFQRRGSISPDGTQVAMVDYPNVDIRASSDGSVVHTFTGLQSGVHFDPVRPLFFAVDTDSDSVRVFSTVDWSEVDNLALGRLIDYDQSKYREGHLSIDPTGQWLAVTFDEGVEFIDLSIFPTTTPVPPSSLTATDNTNADGISVTWTASPGAASYNLYRHTADDSGAAVQIASALTEVQFLDSSIDAGQTYFYWAKAINSFGSSSFSASDAGERRISPPTNLTASDGSEADKIVLNWDPSVSAVSYSVFRSQTNDSGTATEIASGLTTTTYDDTTTVEGETHYYWVLAVNGSGPSDLSGSASGSRMLPSPGDLTIDLDSAAAVDLSWSATPGATSYRILRGATDDPAQSTSIGETGSLEFGDTSAVAGQQYYWFLQAINGDNTSELTPSPAEGRRIFAAPQNLTATNSLRDRVIVSWSNVGGVAHDFEIGRSESNDAASAVVIAETPGTFFVDFSAPRAVPLFYFARAKSTETTGEWSAPIEGFRRNDTFGEYVAGHGLSGAEAEPTADLDDDKFTTFEEWAQGGSDPTDSSSRPPMIPVFQNVSGSDYLTLAYLRFRGGTENGASYEHASAIYEARGNTQLGDGTWDDTPLALPAPAELEAAPDGYEWGCARLPVSTAISAQGFFQLLVTPPLAP